MKEIREKLDSLAKKENNEEDGNENEVEEEKVLLNPIDKNNFDDYGDLFGEEIVDTGA